MDNKDLLQEIRLVREDIKDLQKEFYIFKGKAFGFISLMSFVFSIFSSYLKDKFN
jgi:hypothetical protein